MKIKNKYIAAISLFIVVLLVASCSEDQDTDPTAVKMDARLNMTISTRATADNLTKGGDGKFSSLALYVFNKADGSCEYEELIPVITPQYTDELLRSVQVSPQTKIIYAIGNYNDPDKVFFNSSDAKVTLEDLGKPTLQYLEGLTISNQNGFSDTNILMVGKQETPIEDFLTEVTVPMERLVSRLDIYMFKNTKYKDSEVVVNSIELVNQVTNTRSKYQNTVMVSPVEKRDERQAFSTANSLIRVPEDLSVITPDNAMVSFYSYQNIAGPSAPDSQVTPYLRISVTIDGQPYKYKAYITDNGQTDSKYSLKRNTVYTVMGIIDHPDNILELKTITLPWTKSVSEIGHVVKKGDYELTANNTDATSGIVQYPYVQNGEPQNKTSYVSYNFRLTGPAGAIWTATLTNGLEFTFGKIGSTADKLAISKGIAGDNTYEIKVGATKPWGGTQRIVRLYITVGGEKLKINPVQSNGSRNFPGDNDTDILITQTEYK